MSAKICVAVAVALTVAGCSGRAGPAPTKSAEAGAEAPLSVSSHGCATSFRSPSAGPRTFSVRNDDVQPLAVTLIDADTGSVLGEVRLLDPGTTRPLSLSLAVGRI